MRISDWSSDVCSSDLCKCRTDRASSTIRLRQHVKRMPLGKHGGFAIALTWGTGHGARGDCDLRQVSTFVGKAIGRLNQPAPRIIVGRAHGGMVDNAWMTAMQHTKIMRSISQIGDIARQVTAMAKPAC